MTRTRLTLVSLVVGASLVAAGSASSQPAGRRACNLITPGRIAAILGYQHVQVLRDIAGRSFKTDTGGVVHSVCEGVAWDGAQPPSPTAGRLAVIAGHAAGFGIATWEPDTASDYESTWADKGFGSLTTSVSLGVAFAPSVGALAPYHPRRLIAVGKTAIDVGGGLTGSPRGLPQIVAASGTWWNDPAAAVVAVWVEQAARKPSVTELNRLAKIVDPPLGVKPLTLR